MWKPVASFVLSFFLPAVELWATEVLTYIHSCSGNHFRDMSPILLNRTCLHVLNAFLYKDYFPHIWGKSISRTEQYCFLRHSRFCSDSSWFLNIFCTHALWWPQDQISLRGALLPIYFSVCFVPICFFPKMNILYTIKKSPTCDFRVWEHA